MKIPKCLFLLKIKYNFNLANNCSIYFSLVGFSITYANHDNKATSTIVNRLVAAYQVYLIFSEQFLLIIYK